VTERPIASTTSQIRNIGAVVRNGRDARTWTVGDLAELHDNEGLYK
jgi:hypothetical protein